MGFAGLFFLALFTDSSQQVFRDFSSVTKVFSGKPRNNSYDRAEEVIKILHRRGYTSMERMLFLRQLALILQSGLPLLQGMELLRRRLHKRLRLLCYHVYQLLQHGSSLAEAMEQEPLFFAPLTVQLVRAGELSGQLHAVLEELASYYQQQEELRGHVIKAALYPLFLLAAAGCVLLFFLLYILPVLANVYAGMGIKPTGSMAALLGAHAWLWDNAGLALGAALCLGMGLWRYGRKIGSWLLSRSWCGNFYYLLYEIRFCKLLALLLDSGLNITVAVRVIAQTMQGSPFAKQLLVLESRLRRGVDISSAMLGAAGLLSPLTLDLLGVGASTGCLPQMLREAARLRQEDLQRKLARGKEILAPLLLLIVALVIAVVVCTVLGPLLEMLNALPQ